MTRLNPDLASLRGRFLLPAIAGPLSHFVRVKAICCAASRFVSGSGAGVTTRLCDAFILLAGDAPAIGLHDFFLKVVFNFAYQFDFVRLRALGQ